MQKKFSHKKVVLCPQLGRGWGVGHFVVGTPLLIGRGCFVPKNMPLQSTETNDGILRKYLSERVGSKKEQICSVVQPSKAD